MSAAECKVFIRDEELAGNDVECLIDEKLSNGTYIFKIVIYKGGITGGRKNAMHPV